MYLKLAFRNAKHSIFDYLLYISSMIMLTSIICLSNCIAVWGKAQAGFQTIALPLLIVMIMAVLICYIHHFIIRQRAKEFATYILLGMEKNKLSFVFLCELSVIGLICFILGVALGAGIFSVYYYMSLQKDAHLSILRIILQSSLHTLVYFCLMEILSIFIMRHKIYKLQIIQLMREKQRNQPLGSSKKPFWGWTFLISFSGFLTLLYGISFMPGKVMSISTALISPPILVCVFAFYRWLYAFLASLRQSRAEALYQSSRLYQIAEMTNASRTGANMDTIFCVCLLFSAGAFVFGTLLLNPHISVFKQQEQQWMGFSQISICIIFMIIYFSVFSLLQVIDLKREARNIRLLFHMGKDQSALKRLICVQALTKLFMPMLMFCVILLTAAPFINYKLNAVLPLHNHLFKAIGGFMACFFALYLFYFVMIYKISIRYSKCNMK